jgi:hypothetical protein
MSELQACEGMQLLRGASLVALARGVLVRGVNEHLRKGRPSSQPNKVNGLSKGIAGSNIEKPHE